MSEDIHRFEDSIYHGPFVQDPAETSPEALEAAHEEVEESRAEVLGALAASTEVSSLEQERAENFSFLLGLIGECDSLFDLKRLFESSIDLDAQAGLLSEEQYQQLLNRKSDRERYIKHINSADSEPDIQKRRANDKD